MFVTKNFINYDIILKYPKTNTKTPRAILYTANILIGFLFKYATNLSTTTRATTNETINPMQRVIKFKFVKGTSYFTILSTDAPSIAGIAKKNENSAAAGVEAPIIQPPMIVDADLDMPGQSAKH